jgi:hypothetical protein
MSGGRTIPPHLLYGFFGTVHPQQSVMRFAKMYTVIHENHLYGCRAVSREYVGTGDYQIQV